MLFRGFFCVWSGISNHIFVINTHSAHQHFSTCTQNLEHLSFFSDKMAKQLLFSTAAVAKRIVLLAFIMFALFSTAVAAASVATEENHGKNMLRLESSSSSSSSTSDSLGLTILREYKALEAAAAQQQQQQGSGHHALAASSTAPHYALGFPLITPEALSRLSNKELRQFIWERGGRCDGCVERFHLFERALALRTVPTKNEEIVSMLTPFSTAFSTDPAAPLSRVLPVDLIRPLSETELPMIHAHALSTSFLKDPRYHCEIIQKNIEGGMAKPADGSEPRYLTEEEGMAMEKARAALEGPRQPEISCRLRTAEDGKL